MAPKRQRTSRSSSSSIYDHSRFVSEEASECFHNSLVNKKLIPERGLGPQKLNGIKIRRMIQERGWGILTTQSEAAVVAIVRNSMLMQRRQ